MMAFESGIDREDLERAMLPRLAPKAIYVDGWVYIPNWIKYHLSTSGTVSPQHQKGFDTAWAAVPERIRLKIKEVAGKVYPIQGVSPSASASASALTTDSLRSSEVSVVETKLDRYGNEIVPKEPKGGTKAYADMCDWLEKTTGVKIVNRAKQYAHLAKAKKADISPTRLKNRATELLEEPWYQAHGLDWGSVVSSFDKRA